MKIIIPILLTAVLCLFIGYKIYPVLNSSTSSDDTNKELDIVSEQEKAYLYNESHLSNKNSNSSQEPSETLKESAPELNNITQSNNTEISVSSNDNNPQSSESYQSEEILINNSELNQWSQKHTEQLLEQIDAIAPEYVAEHMREHITKDNNFLVAPLLQQDPTEDSNWAFAMEQLITDLIASHELSYDFELHNLTCKQLMCGILGIEKVSGSWTKIYLYILQNAPNIVLPIGENQAVNMSYQGVDVSYAYTQLEFNNN